MIKKIKTRIVPLLFAGLVLAAGFIEYPRYAYANSAYIPPNNQFDISVGADGADIGVSAELLTFDFVTTESYYIAQVSAEYTMNSPSAKTVSLGFPLVSTLSSLSNGVSVDMNGQSLSYDVYILHNNDYIHADYDRSEIHRGFADLTFDQQLQAAIPKSYRSVHENQSGWLYKLDDNFYGCITFSADFVVLAGDMAVTSIKDGVTSVLVSGGGYLFSYEERLNLTTTPVASYTEEECVLGDLQRRLFPVEYYSDAAYLYDKYTETQGYSTVSLNLFLDNFLTQSRSVMLVYNAPFVAGENNMTVRYGIAGSTDYKSTSATFFYYTNPARAWNSFGNLTVHINTYHYVPYCNLPLKRQTQEKTLYQWWDGAPYTRTYNRYVYTGGLPEQNLRFSSGTKKTSYNSIPEIYIIIIVFLAMFILLTVLSVLSVVFIVKYKRMKTRMKILSLPHKNSD